MPFSPDVEHGRRHALAVVTYGEQQRPAAIAELDVYS
jgi:hypothetical protein